MRVKHGALLLARGLAAAALLGAAGPAASVDLQGLLELARRNDPTYLAAREAREASRQATPVARSRLLPRIDIEGSVSRVRQELRSPDRPETDFTSKSIALTITQPVYRRDLRVALRQARTSVRRADVDFAFSYQDLLLRVASAYFDVLNAVDDLRFERANKQAIAQQLKQAEQRFEVGLIAITGVREAQARFDLATASELAAENALDNAREAMREITGQVPEQLSTLGAEVPLAIPEPADIDAWTRTALQQNLRVQSANYAMLVAQEEIERQSSGHYPTLDLVARMGRSDVGGGVAARDLQDASLGLELTVPLYQGNGVVAATREARARYREALQQLEVARRSVQRQTREAFLGIRSGIARVRALSQAVVSNQSALDAVEAGFQVGTRTSVDVLDAQRDLLQAQSDYASARYAYILDILRLKQAAGTLSDEDIRAVNSWLR